MSGKPFTFFSISLLRTVAVISPPLPFDFTLLPFWALWVIKHTSLQLGIQTPCEMWSSVKYNGSANTPSSLTVSKGYVCHVMRTLAVRPRSRSAHNILLSTSLGFRRTREKKSFHELERHSEPGHLWRLMATIDQIFLAKPQKLHPNVTGKFRALKDKIR